MIMKTNGIPEICFKVYRRDNPPDWLIVKRNYLERKWNENKDGKKLIEKIMKTCNLSFPRDILDNGIDVILKKYSRRKHGKILGFVLPTKPTRIYVFVKKKYRYSDFKPTLCHELIHSLMWARYYLDGRRKIASLFADIFADELITTILEEFIIKGKMSDIDFGSALDYAREEAYVWLKNLKRMEGYDRLLDELKTYLKEYRRAIREGKDVLQERERMLQFISSPLPLSLEE